MEENFNLIQAKSFVEQLNLDLLDVKKSFFKIGFRLDEAQRLKYYKELGFENISDCAEALFGFKKSTTYNFINVYKAFNDGTMFLPKQWQKFSQSQLIEMSTCSNLRNILKPEDTIKDIKYFKSLQSKSGYYWSNSIKTLSEYICRLEKIVHKSPEDEERQVLQPVKVAVLPPEKLIEENIPEENQPKENFPEEEKHNVERSEIFQTSGKIEDTKTIKEKNNELKTLSDLLGNNEKNYISKNHSAVKKDLTEKLYSDLSIYNYSITFNDRKQSFKVFLGVIVNCFLDYLKY